MKYNLNNVYIEVTRRCNMSCPHCMRGPAQNVDLSKEDINMFFDKFNCESIRSLTFGGGEPTVAPDIVSYIVDQIIVRKIKVGAGLITNGKVFSKEVADALNRLDEYDKQLREPGEPTDYVSSNIMLGFSVDKYHNIDISEVKEKYRNYCKWLYLYDNVFTDDKIVQTGNATFGRPYEYHPSITYYGVEDDKTAFIDEQINLSARGFVNTNGFGSYVDMDKCNFGHISNFDVRKFLLEHGIRLDSIHTVETDSNGQKQVIERKLGYLK